MKKKILLWIIFTQIMLSCSIDKKVIKYNNDFKSVNLDANHASNDKFRLLYNSLDTTSTTLIVNKKVIEKSNIKHVLDTLNVKNFKINVDKKQRIIEFIKN